MSRYLLVEKSPNSLVAQIRLIVGVGSATDPKSTPGLTHLMARALLRGTKSVPYPAIALQIEELGGSLNATCDHEYVHLMGEILEENLPRFLAILADVIHHPAFSDERIAELKSTLEGELRSSLQDVRTAASRALFEAVFRGTQGEHSPFGTVDGVSSATRAQIETQFARLSKAPLVLGIASSRDESEILAILEKEWGSFAPAPESLKPVAPLSEPLKGGRRAILAKREETATVPLFIAVKSPGEGSDHALALDIANFPFGGDFTAKIMQVLRAQNGWTYGASSGFSQLLSPKREWGLFSLYTFPSTEFADRAIPRALELFEDFIEKGLTQEELDSARLSLGNRHAFNLDTSAKRLQGRLRRLLTGKQLHSPAEFRKRIAELSLAQVNQLLRSGLSTQELWVAAAGEESRLEPILRNLRAISKVETLDVQA